MFCRICLAETNYTEIDYKVLSAREFPQLESIYNAYCEYKQFESQVPLFVEEFENPLTETIGYYDKETLVAFSLIYLYPSKKSCMAEQFAWNYENKKLKLGYRSIRSECARYKRLGYEYLYLGEIAGYKKELQGFEVT